VDAAKWAPERSNPTQAKQLVTDSSCHREPKAARGPMGRCAWSPHRCATLRPSRVGLRGRDLQPSTLHFACADWARGRSLPWPRLPGGTRPAQVEAGTPDLTRPKPRHLDLPKRPQADLARPTPWRALALLPVWTLVNHVYRRTGPRKGAGSYFVEPLRTGPIRSSESLTWPSDKGRPHCSVKPSGQGPGTCRACS
jgi:hypothetical protein